MGNTYGGCPSMCTPGETAQIKKVKRSNKPKKITSSMITDDADKIQSMCQHCKTLLKKRQLNQARRRQYNNYDAKQFLTIQSEKTNFCTCQKINSYSKSSQKFDNHIKKLNDFQVIRGLGRGAYGKVYMIRQKVPVFNQLDESLQYTMNAKKTPKISDLILQQDNYQISQKSSIFRSQTKFDKEQKQTKKINLFETPNKRNNESISQKSAKNDMPQLEINITTPNISKITVSKEAIVATSVQIQNGIDVCMDYDSDQQVNPSLKQVQKYYAMKVIQKQKIKSDEDRCHLLSERYILEAVNNPFIVKLHYAFQTPTKLYLIVDLMPGGQLFYLLRQKRRFSQDVAKFYAAQILLALEYLHDRNIIYRDLKPENILLDGEGHIKLTDFGLSKVCYHDRQMVYSLCGTPEYIAPQVILGKGYSKSADWFSFGSLLYDMLTGKPPFYCSNKNTMMKNLISKPIPLPKSLSAEAKSLLNQLFSIQPEQRLGYRNSQQIKNHPFFKQIDFYALSKKALRAPIQFNKSQLSGETKVSRNIKTQLKIQKQPQLYVNSQGFQKWNSCDIVQVDNSMMRQGINADNQIHQNNLEGFTYNRPNFMGSPEMNPTTATGRVKAS